MKRRLLIVVVFLLAGAVVNVAVAWGCCFFVELPWPSSAYRPSKAEIEYWTSRTPDNFGKPAIPLVVGSIESFGVRRRTGWSMSPESGMSKEKIIQPAGAAFFSAGVVEAGWPVVCVNGQWWMEGSSGASDPLVVDGIALRGSDFRPPALAAALDGAVQ